MPKLPPGEGETKSTEIIDIEALQELVGHPLPDFNPDKNEFDHPKLGKLTKSPNQMRDGTLRLRTADGKITIRLNIFDNCKVDKIGETGPYD